MTIPWLRPLALTHTPALRATQSEKRKGGERNKSEDGSNSKAKRHKSLAQLPILEQHQCHGQRRAHVRHHVCQRPAHVTPRDVLPLAARVRHPKLLTVRQEGVGNPGPFRTGVSARSEEVVGHQSEEK